MQTRICILASSSKGNCTVIWNDKHALLIDCGVGIKYFKSALARLGVDIFTIRGVLITHLHRDHVNPVLGKALKRHGIPLYCHADAQLLLERMHHKSMNGSTLSFDGTQFVIDCFAVDTFDVPHDCGGGCRGFKISWEHSGLHSLALATDLAEARQHLIPHFCNLDTLILESNHDTDMLWNDRIPWILKKRIAESHLSNEQCGDFLKQVLLQSQRAPKSIMLAHISQDRNTQELALHSARFACEAVQADSNVVISHQREKSQVICID
ncbi:MAG: MBL fold metallo-hydrolase [Chitinivibrionales bacterium]|nr:MBL fold metallo-hydrolase [Chitinivibrionales bacterium]